MKMHLILAFAFSLQSAIATSFYIRPFSEFTKTTPNIIRGKISNIHVENGVTPDGSKTIYTFANLQIKDTIKGSISGSQIQIRKLGGTKDGVTLEIPSSVEFSDNEEGVFFLSEEQEDHTYEVSSLELGKFNLVEKKGVEILTGGIFSYSKPRPGHEHDHTMMAENAQENLKPWSINQLRALVKSQQKPPLAEPQNPKNPEVSINQPELRSSSTPSPTISAPPLTSVIVEQDKSGNEENENSPLYFDSTIWYSLAIVILTLGVILLLRKK